ncbi:hypothetical protein [Nitrospira moscoviensis]|uniref:PhnA-like protein n=1 Tax=Nitrospira moscoviensis TaxID=42253 RepID=A0A0K2GDG1_NITMO|nr:hypothetical protein [Nitrospira moscoviensis]ALA58983.1 conserved membrane protein of unknown function [Nitrospira moscoviensis]
MEVERTFEQWSLGSPRIKWSAVFAGWAVGLAVQMLLTLLGLGFGAWAIDLQDTNQGVPVGAGIWTGLSMLIAAFTGGYVTARMSGTYLPSDGMWHGVVVWGVNWLIFAWLTTTAMSAMIGGVFSVFGTTLQTLGQSVSGIASTAAGQIGSRMGQLNISGEEIRRQIESVLAATGKPELQPGEVRGDAERVAGAARGGRPLNEVSESAWTELQQKLVALDRDAAINVMVNKFGMSETQAKQVVQSTIGVLEPIRQTVQEAVGTVREQSNQALDRLGTIALWLSVLALITLGLSAWGGMVGTPDESTVAAHAASESFRTDMRRAG